MVCECYDSCIGCCFGWFYLLVSLCLVSYWVIVESWLNVCILLLWYLLFIMIVGVLVMFYFWISVRLFFICVVIVFDVVMCMNLV